MVDQALSSTIDCARAQLTVLASPCSGPGLLTLRGLLALHETYALVFYPRHHDDAVLGMARRDDDRLAVHLEEWLTQGEAVAQLQQLLQTRGRLVMLLGEMLPQTLETLAPHLERLEAAGIPVQRLHV